MQTGQNPFTADLWEPKTLLKDTDECCPQTQPNANPEPTAPQMPKLSGPKLKTPPTQASVPKRSRTLELVVAAAQGVCDKLLKF